MKTAISLPDPIFEEAERVAARLGLSRRELSGGAEDPAGVDPMLARLQAALLATDEGGLEDWVGVPKPRRRGRAKRG